MSSTTNVKDFFVSFTASDRVWAEWIAWELEAAGYSVIFQDWDFGIGNDFVVKMQAAASECRRTIAVLSPSYLRAKFTQSEWSSAFALDPTGEKQTLVPIRIVNFKPGGLFAARVYIDLVGTDEATARERVTKGVKLGRKKRSLPPSFPGARPVPEFPGNPARQDRAHLELAAPLRAALDDQWKACAEAGVPFQTTHKLLTLSRVAPDYLRRVFGNRREKIFSWLRKQAEKEVLTGVRTEEVWATIEADRTTVAAAALAAASASKQVDVRHYLLAILDDPHSRIVEEIRKKFEGIEAGSFLRLRKAAESAPIEAGTSTNFSSLDLGED